MNQKIKSFSKKIIGDRLYRNIRSKYHNPSELSGFFGALPDFIIVGAQKSGTTSLYKYLSRHPKIIPASKKEVHFFDKSFHKGVISYRSYFPSYLKLKLEGCITGEATPYYLYHPHVPRRMEKLIPDVKLIILLRDPVERAISHYWHEVNWCESEDLMMEEAFKQEEKRINKEKKNLKKER